jgi:hypothetical protein
VSKRQPLPPAFWEELDAIIASLHESIGRYRRNFGCTKPEPVPEDPFDEQLLERIYPHGDVLTDRQWARLMHHDLSEMSKAQLMNERACLRLRLMLDPQTADLWLSDRTVALEAEIARRG